VTAAGLDLGDLVADLVRVAVARDPDGTGRPATPTGPQTDH
jgi:hypothetical protein